jgi:hypothetical protein
MFTTFGGRRYCKDRNFWLYLVVRIPPSQEEAEQPCFSNLTTVDRLLVESLPHI